MDEQTFVPPTMRALYHTPLSNTTPPPPDPTALENPHSRPPSQSTLIFDPNFPTPKPSPTQYLIKVQTAAFCHDELRLSRILNPMSGSMPQVPLHNMCGTVISTPSQDHWREQGPKFKVDDVVFGLVSYARDGAAADYVLAREGELAQKPKNITGAEASAVALPGLTAWQALFMYGDLEPKTPMRVTNSERSSSGANGVAGDDGKQLRVLITNARDSEVGMQTIQLLRAPSLFPQTEKDKPWICATVSSNDQATYLHTNASTRVNETILAPLPLGPDFNLSTTFHRAGWAPVDIVIDCAGGSMFRQAHSPHVVRDHGVVLTAVDSAPAQVQLEKDDGREKRGLFSRFIGVKPDGEALGRIAKLVEEGSVRGCVESIVDLVNGADILDAGGAGANGARRGGMIVLKVN